MKMHAVVIGLLSLLAATSALAKGHSHSKRGYDLSPKSVHVHSYTKKNGARIQAYKRRTPK